MSILGASNTHGRGMAEVPHACDDPVQCRRPNRGIVTCICSGHHPMSRRAWQQGANCVEVRVEHCMVAMCRGIATTMDDLILSAASALPVSAQASIASPKTSRKQIGRASRTFASARARGQAEVLRTAPGQCEPNCFRCCLLLVRCAEPLLLPSHVLVCEFNAILVAIYLLRSIRHSIILEPLDLFGSEANLLGERIVAVAIR